MLTVRGELMDTATATDDQRRRVVRLIRGEVQTTEQVQSYQDATRRLFKEREVLANLMRQETGREPVVFPIHGAESEAQGKNDASNGAVCADEEVASMLTTERRTSINRD